MLNTVYLIMGVSGSGKTTIGKLLAQKLSVPFYDADGFHPQRNIDKMQTGIPLTDEDRVSWLEAIHQKIAEERLQNGAVITCSALKEKYRVLLSKGVGQSIKWCFLQGDYELIKKRMMAREDHFFPESLLRSQFQDLEIPIHINPLDIRLKPAEIVAIIMNENMSASSEFGVVGLGVMGKSLSRNLAQKGVKLSLFNRHVAGKEENVAVEFVDEYDELEEATGFDDLRDFVASLSVPRKILLMVNAGKPTETVIHDLVPLLDKGDLIIDAGNTYYKNTHRRASYLAKKGIKFIGTGVSGGEEGALKGPAIMPGGDLEAYESVKHYLEVIAAKDFKGKPCCTFVGRDGAGHFVKMVHNGIEYAEMQLIAEVYELLRLGCGMTVEDISALFEDWNRGDLKSYLLEISYKILRVKEGGVPLIDLILDKAGNKGTGGWTTVSSTELGVATTMMTNALYARYTSAMKKERVAFETKLGRANQEAYPITIEQVQKAYRVARLLNHHQGFKLIDQASEEYQWAIDLAEIARIWTNGCIIRSTLMENLAEVFGKTVAIFDDMQFVEMVKEARSSLQEVNIKMIKAGISAPCISNALTFLNAITSGQSSANMIQAQRDFFGAHTFQRIDAGEESSFHHAWES